MPFSIWNWIDFTTIDSANRIGKIVTQVFDARFLCMCASACEWWAGSTLAYWAPSVPHITSTDIFRGLLSPLRSPNNLDGYISYDELERKAFTNLANCQQMILHLVSGLFLISDTFLSAGCEYSWWDVPYALIWVYFPERESLDHIPCKHISRVF